MIIKLLHLKKKKKFISDTPADYELKFGLLDDTLSVIDLEGRRTQEETRVGGFDMIYNNG